MASSVVREADVPQNEVSWLTRDCKVIFRSDNSSLNIPPGYRREFDQSNSDSELVTANLTQTCTRVLSYADQVLRNSRREELALIGSEFWAFGLSVFAVMYCSVPHLLADFCMRFLSLVWSLYSIWRTLDIKQRFDVLITNGACGHDLLSGYFEHRIVIQIIDIVLNFIAFLLSIFFVWKLIKTYHRKTFNRIGAPPHVMRAYKVFLGVLTCLQVAVYFLVTGNALWIDQLFNGPLAHISSHNTEYIIGFTILNVLLLPWIAIGWFAIRLEMKRTMWTFLGLGAFYTCSWGFLYYSQVFRWTWIQWPFFACMTLSAQIAELACVILAVVCYKNFHKGLAQYLHAESALAKDDFEPEVFTNDTESVPHRDSFEVNFKSISIYSDGASVSESKVGHDIKLVSNFELSRLG